MCSSIPNSAQPQPSHCPDHLELRQQKNCHICRGLEYGSKCIGYFDGELIATAREPKEAKIHIGPLSLFQFGNVRDRLHWNNHNFFGPTWYACKDTRTIYLYHDLPSATVQTFREWNCTMHRQDSIAQQLQEPIAENTDSGILVSFKFGEEKMSFTVRVAITPEEFCAVLEQLTCKVRSVPPKRIVRSEI